MVTVTKVRAKSREVGVADAAKFQAIWSEAAEASRRAYIQHKEWDRTFPCGIGWITIPNRGKFAAWLLQNDLARKNTYESGLTLRTYSGNNFAPPTQSYELHVLINRAIVNVLHSHGIQATSTVRID